MVGTQAASAPALHRTRAIQHADHPFASCRALLFQSAPESEVEETPILCETCLGPNPYVRMAKQPRGMACKVCSRPFTVFRWNPGVGMRFKKTEICTTCAKIKNVCQTCILDLQYGLPVQVRDTALNLKQSMPNADANRHHYIQAMESQLEGATSLIDSSAGPSSRAGQELLKKMARRDPGYKRNRPHLCSFYAKGNCTRGDECPYRHELPVDNELSKQNLQDRFHGTNDPVARKMLGAHAKEQGLAPPEDKSVVSTRTGCLPLVRDDAPKCLFADGSIFEHHARTLQMSLFLSALSPTTTEDEIRTFFINSVPQLQPHHIKSITLVAASKCAFVNFKTRQAAEWAAERCAIKVELGGKEVRVGWGRSRPGKKGGSGAGAASTSSAPAAAAEAETAGSLGVPS
ncbi:related to Cell cycle control protein cwf5 [Pseudozyma flocculosa]|uniref:Related to Cell cycle control protein cwf5 n=1 Tax=Pseudozyma flocculosa TaxID=84751 RepID=A0A5C3ET59_9BASI|nr:related to Cell cycle control protein cwf5 [Pseudozyma flocculosa]